MGVKALWPLLQKLAVPIDLDTLHNEVLAIDFSIWLNQSIKGYRDKRGYSLENSHLLGLFQRICKLLFFKIKPVFVFDGGAPYLKRQTIDARKNRKLKSLQNSDVIARKTLKKHLSKQLKLPLDANSDSEPEIGLESTRRILLDDDDTFNLPVIEEDFESESQESSNHSQNYHSNANHFQNLDEIDTESESFKSLPAEIRHELLTHIKEKRKGWARIKEFPSETNDFSAYQMNRLLHKRQIQEKIEKVEDEMQSNAESDMFFEGTSTAVRFKTRRMASDENTHLIYVDKSQKNASKMKIETLSAAIMKKSSNVFAEVSEFDYGKSEAIKEDKSSFIQNNSTFSSIKTTKILHRTLKNDFKTRKASSTYSLSQRSDDYIASSSPEKVVETNNNIYDVYHDQVESNCSQCPASSCSQQASNLEPDFVDLNSDSNDSFVEVSELSQKSNKPKSSTRLELVFDSPTKTSETNNSLSGLNQVPESASVPVSVKEESEQVDNEFDEEPDTVIASFLSKVTSKEVTDEVNSSQKPDSISKLVSPAKSIVSVNDCQVFQSSSLECTPKKRSEKLFTELRETVKSSPCKQTRDELNKELYLMEREVGRLERHANSVTEQMIVECQELLRLFGIPYVMSPMEAEAQCAALENLGLTAGTITDDSDIWLFGGKTVFKNFFTQSKFVEKYQYKDIEEHLKLNRESMICLALLTGSDYTEGVEGIGGVTALEILSEFNEPGFESLVSFKKWWTEKHKGRNKAPGNKTRAKFLKFSLNDGFPNRVVFDAYTSPTVDETPEGFKWGIPDLDLLRDYATRKFGWTRSKVDETLLPVIKKLNERKVQKRIDDYFKCDVRRNGQIADSKRVMTAIHKMGSSTEPDQKQPKLVKKTKPLQDSKLKQKVRKNATRGRNKNTTKSAANKATKATLDTLKSNKSSNSHLSESSSEDD